MGKVDEEVKVVKDNKICKEICTAQTNLFSGFLLFDLLFTAIQNKTYA